MTTSTYDEKDNSSEETRHKPIIKNGPTRAEVNGRDLEPSVLEMEENISFEELRRKYESLVSEVDEHRSRVNEMTTENETFQRQLRAIDGGAFVDVREVNDLRSMVVERLQQVRECIETESAEKSRLFSQLQQAVIDKDRALANMREFRMATKQQLLDLQASLDETPAPANDGVSRHLHEQLRQKYHQSEERRAASERRVGECEKRIRHLMDEKDRIEKDKVATVKKLTKRMQNEKNRFTNDKKELEDRSRAAELEAQEAKSHRSELENDNRRLERDLRIKTEEYDALVAEDRSQQQESSKKLLVKERTIERQIQVERELRYDLEQKMNALTDESSENHSELTNLREKCGKMERELERTKTSHEDKERELTMGNKKLDEMRQHEREMELAKDDAENRARHLEEKCKNMAAQINDIQQALDKKVKQEKALKNKQKQVRDKEKELISRERKMERDAEQIHNTRGHQRGVGGKGGNVRIKPIKSRDPWFQYRNLLPWPWMVLGLLIILFFSIVMKQ